MVTRNVNKRKSKEQRKAGNQINEKSIIIIIQKTKDRVRKSLVSKITSSHEIKKEGFNSRCQHCTRLL